MARVTASGVPAAEPELPDTVLVRRADEGDPRAFEVLLRRHQRAAFATALRVCRRPADAEEAVQDAFVAAWRELPGFRGDSAFSTWLHRIVTTRALNQVRARGRHDDRRTGDDIGDLVGAAEPVASGTGPAGSAEAADLATALRAALAGLPTAQRECWLLREVEGCSYEEVAEITGSSVTAVRGRLHRARIAVAEAMAAWR